MPSKRLADEQRIRRGWGHEKRSSVTELGGVTEKRRTEAGQVHSCTIRWGFCRRKGPRGAGRSPRSGEKGRTLLNRQTGTRETFALLLQRSKGEGLGVRRRSSERAKKIGSPGKCGQSVAKERLWEQRSRPPYKRGAATGVVLEGTIGVGESRRAGPKEKRSEATGT